MATIRECSEEGPNYSKVMIFAADSAHAGSWKLNAQNISNKCIVKAEII